MFKLSDYGIVRTSFNLSNGTPVVFFRKPNSPLSMEASFISGSRFDPAEKKGLAHFVEHMILAGTQNFPTKDLLAGFMEDLGGSVGASTGSDLIHIGFSLGESTDFEHGVYILNEILTNSLFNEKTIETERKAILRELDGKKSSPSKWLGELTRELLYQETDLELPTLGSEESIKNINRDDLINFYKTNFNGGVCGITICGDLDPKFVQDTLETGLNIPKGERKVFTTELPIIRNKYRAFKYFDNNHLLVDLSFRTPKMLDEDVRPLGFLASILTGGRTGSLKKKLRYEKGLVYSVGSGTSAQIDRGDFGIGCGISKETAQEVMDIICTDIKRIATNGPTEDELQLSKNRGIKSIRIPMQSVGNWVHHHKYKNIFYPELNWTVEDDLELSEKVTVDDIKRVTAKYIRNDAWYLTMAGPASEELINGIQVNL